MRLGATATTGMVRRFCLGGTVLLLGLVVAACGGSSSTSSTTTQASSGTPKAGGAAKSKLLGADMNPAGGQVVTYSKWPLYTYAGDHKAGQANGQDTTLSGGKWYVITPAGTLIKHKG